MTLGARGSGLHLVPTSDQHLGITRLRSLLHELDVDELIREAKYSDDR
jgi:hypothetical protein